MGSTPTAPAETHLWFLKLYYMKTISRHETGTEAFFFKEACLRHQRVHPPFFLPLLEKGFCGLSLHAEVRAGDHHGLAIALTLELLRPMTFSAPTMRTPLSSSTAWSTWSWVAAPLPKCFHLPAHCARGASTSARNLSLRVAKVPLPLSSTVWLLLPLAVDCDRNDYWAVVSLSCEEGV